MKAYVLEMVRPVAYMDYNNVYGYNGNIRVGMSIKQFGITKEEKEALDTLKFGTTEKG